MEEEDSLLNEEKKKHPLERANIFSKLFFCWLLPYFVKGYKRELTENDLYGPLESHESKRLGDKLEAEWDRQVANKKKPSLLIALWKVFYLELAVYGLLYVTQEFIVKLSQPLLIAQFLRLYETNQTEISSKYDAYIYAGLIIIFALVNVLCIHNYYFCVMHLGMKLRVATSSLIYRKALKLNKTALAETTVGQMVNLLSNDVGRLDFAVLYLHNLWVAPIEVGVIMYLLYKFVGPTGLVGAGFLILFILPQMYMGKKISQYRSNTAKCTDERVRLMGEIINGIQVIKLYTWEKSFAKLVEISRRMEMKQIWATSIIRALMNTCITVLHRSAIYLCILTYFLTGNVITATYAYTIASFYGILRQAVTMFLPRAVTQFAETRTSIQRIQTFLSRNEITPTNSNNNLLSNENHEKEQLQDLNKEEIGIRLSNVSVQRTNSSQENALENVTFGVNPGQLVAVVGTVGGGKTTLLNTILKEVTPTEGSVYIGGTISYASQEAWLFEGNVQQNIIFGNKLNIDKYNHVVRVCDLQRDFKQLAYGDQTLVKELSGGQKARVNLARAIYREADIYLLDDPLSAVDTGVGKHLFDNCIRGYLKGKCVILVTNQLQYLQNADVIYLIQNGTVVAKGSYDELRESDNDFSEFLVEKNEEKERVLEVKPKRESLIVAKDKPVQEKEQRGSGKISKSVYKTYLRAGGNCCTTLLVLSTFLLAQTFAIFADYFVILWVNLEQWRSLKKWNNETNVLTNGTNVTLTNISSIKNDTSKDLTDQDAIQSTLDSILTPNISIIIYSLLILLSVIIALIRSIAFFKYCVTASSKLHSLMIEKIIKAPIKFFISNPPGRILNRFSKDIGTLDEILPMTIVDTLQIALILLSVSVVVGILYAWILIPTAIIIVIFYYLRLVFLATSRDIKRVEAVSRSPMYTHLRASIQGLTTIRAFGAQNVVKRGFDDYQNQYTSACFLFLGANRTFGFWLDFHCVVYTASIIICVLFIDTEIFGGNVGYALTEAICLTGTFQWGIRQWSEMENQMTAVERIQEYIDVVPETEEKARDPPQDWPEKGNIIFQKLSLKYYPDDPYVLKDLTFVVKPREKVGIVGRTGAGKSSIVAALFRLVDAEGEILIDNVNIKDISLHDLRSKISIIPQEPVLFSGTVRQNLDPFGNYSDDMLWNVLDNVELKNTISDLPSGLDEKIQEGGSNFSVGQRQLICLARAMLRNNKILVLDEATANVDPYTDELIQNTIREKFAQCSVLTIAHRLHTVMDSERVFVLDAGRIVECDHPYRLLAHKDSYFYQLVAQTGEATTRMLESKAEQYYKRLEETKDSSKCETEDNDNNS